MTLSDDAIRLDLAGLAVASPPQSLMKVLGLAMKGALRPRASSWGPLGCTRPGPQRRFLASSNIRPEDVPPFEPPPVGEQIAAKIAGAVCFFWIFYQMRREGAVYLVLRAVGLHRRITIF